MSIGGPHEVLPPHGAWRTGGLQYGRPQALDELNASL